MGSCASRAACKENHAHDGHAPAPSCPRVLASDQSSNERFFFGGRTRASSEVPHRTKHRTRNALLGRQTEESLAFQPDEVAGCRWVGRRRCTGALCSPSCGVNRHRKAF